MPGSVSYLLLLVPCSISCSLRAGAGEDYAYGAQDDFDVEPDAPVLDIGDVEGNVAVERRILAGLDLPEAGDARGYVQAAQVRELVLTHFAGDRRTGADDAHVAEE